MTQPTVNTAVDGVAGTGVVKYTKLSVWYAVGLLTFVNVVNYVDRMALSILLPAIKVDLDLSDTQLGLLTGIAFALFYAGFGIPIARWADRGNRRNIVSLALVVWSLATSVSGAVQNFWQLFVARMVVGVGEAGCIPPSQSIISDYVPAKRRIGALALHNAGAFMGMVIGLALGGWLSSQIGWRLTFLVLGLPGLAVALIVRSTLREPVRGWSDGVVSDQGLMPLKAVVGYLWARRSYVHIVMVFAIGAFATF